MISYQYHIKRTPLVCRLLVIWILLSKVGYIHNKPVTATTTKSSVIGRAIEISDHPKIIDISIPVTSTEDLIAWATYAIRLMAARFNVTVNHMKNDSKSILYNSEMLPKMESIVKKIMKQIPKMKTVPTKPTIYHKDDKLKNAEAEPRGFEVLVSSTTIKPSLVNSRSFDVYPKISDHKIPFNPFAGIFLETAEFNPFIRYAPNVIAGQYEPSGTRLFPEHTIFPGVGYLPLNTKVNPFANLPLQNVSKLDERKEPTTTMTSTTVELSGPEKIKNFNNAFEVESVTTTSRPLITVPFEAFITITRDGAVPPAQITVSTNPTIPGTSLSVQTIPDSYSTINDKKGTDYYATTVRDPPDEFPPYFNNDRLKVNQNTKVEVIFDEETISTTPKIEEKKNKEKVKKEKSKLKKNKKKQQSSPIEEALIKLVGSRKRNNTTNTINKDTTPPIIRIVSERQQNLRKELKKQKNIRLQNATLETDVDDYDDERLGENDNENNDDKLAEGDEDRQNESGSSSQENDDDEDEEEEEEMGLVATLLEILPLVAPILEDLSDPNTETDFAGLIQAVVPLIQGVLEGDEDTPGLDVGGTIGPLLASLSAGPNGQGSDVAAVLGPLLSLVVPLIGPIVGPVIGPLSRLSSNPPDKGFSLPALINTVAGQLSQPIEPGGMTPFSNLVTQIVATLSKEVSRGGIGSDLGALISSVLMGVIAGTSAGLSNASKDKKDTSHRPPYGIPHNQAYGPIGSSSTYGNNAVPAHTVNPIQLIGTSLKDILNAGVTIISSLITAATGLLGASSASEQKPTYSPPPSYGNYQTYTRHKKFAST